MDPAAELELVALSRQQAMNEAIARGDSEIQRFYKNSVVFMTGGSGFLGKQLIEKLLRSCNLSKIYLLLRPKKGKNIEQRLNDIAKEPVFDALRKKHPDFVTKIVAIAGDVAEIKLGLKEEDWKTLSEEVNVIFHVAATTKFDETIRVATLINVRGTREILALGKACKNLKSYVHVSTAYTHATTKLIGEEVEEEFYKSPVPPETMISMAESLDQDRLIGITAELIKNWPNTYTFTKSIAEELVRTTSAGLPICIVRPGIVLCSNSEPSPGWIDVSCVYGATGFLLGLGLGVLHTIRADANTVLGFTPCDYVNNVIITAGRETATNQAKGGNDTRIYTVSTTQRNPVKWGQLKQVIEEIGPTLQTPSAIYYSYARDTSNMFLYMFYTLFLHIIPAYIADFVCLLMGKERSFLYFGTVACAMFTEELCFTVNMLMISTKTMTMVQIPFVKIAKKVYYMCNVLSFFLLNEWKFIDNNTEKLYSSLSKDDKDIFNFDVTQLNWTEYITLWCIGIRKYIVKDGLKGTNYAIKKRKVLRIGHYLFTSVYIYGVWKLLCLVFYVASSLLSAVINVF